MNNKVVRIAFLSALLIISKEILSFLPNVELVTVLLMCYTYTIGKNESLYVVMIFTIIQAILYPIHIWIITYVIIWSMLVMITSVLKNKNASLLTISLFAALFGLSFGFIDSIVHSFIYGLNSFLPLWLRGMPWDFIHAISNYLTVLLLFNPITNIFDKIKSSGH